MYTLIHTSDWHLGHRLGRHERFAEQQAFLEWLLGLVGERRADALVVAGDIFDVANPPIEAVRLFYRFLVQVREHCPNVVIVGGNHDSGARLDALGPLARELGITLVGSLPEPPTDCIVPLRNRDGICFARLAAVPYLRPGDLAASAADEDVDAQHSRVLRSIEAIYADVLHSAEEELEPGEALVVTGHLFARGGIVTEGERAAHVEAGKLLAVGPGIFGERAAYVALGHLHRCQRIRKEPPAWYSGTPVPLSFDEAEQILGVQAVTLDRGVATAVETVPVPRFRALYDLVGDGDAVLERLASLAEAHPAGESPAWLRVTVREAVPDPAIPDAVREAIAGSGLLLLGVRRQAVGEGGALADAEPERRLDELTPDAVFGILHEERFGGPPEGPVADAFAELLQGVLAEEGGP